MRMTFQVHPGALVLLAALLTPACALYDGTAGAISGNNTSDMSTTPDMGVDMGVDMAKDMADPCAACPETCITSTLGGLCPDDPRLAEKCMVEVPTQRRVSEPVDDRIPALLYDGQGSEELLVPVRGTNIQLPRFKVRDGPYLLPASLDDVSFGFGGPNSTTLRAVSRLTPGDDRIFLLGTAQDGTLQATILKDNASLDGDGLTLPNNDYRHACNDDLHLSVATHGTPTANNPQSVVVGCFCKDTLCGDGRVLGAQNWNAANAPPSEAITARSASQNTSLHDTAFIESGNGLRELIWIGPDRDPDKDLLISVYPMQADMLTNAGLETRVISEVELKKLDDSQKTAGCFEGDGDFKLDTTGITRGVGGARLSTHAAVNYLYGAYPNTHGRVIMFAMRKLQSSSPWNIVSMGCYPQRKPTSEERFELVDIQGHTPGTNDSVLLVNEQRQSTRGFSLVWNAPDVRTTTQTTTITRPNRALLARELLRHKDGSYTVVGWSQVQAEPAEVDSIFLARFTKNGALMCGE